MDQERSAMRSRHYIREVFSIETRRYGQIAFCGHTGTPLTGESRVAFRSDELFEAGSKGKRLQLTIRLGEVAAHQREHFHDRKLVDG